MLAAMRALHFVAAVSLLGAFAFDCFVAVPSARRGGGTAAAALWSARRVDRIAAASLILGFASGLLWLAAVAANISGQPLGAVSFDGVLWTTLTRTRFGEDWLVRLALAVLLGVAMLVRRRHGGGAPAWAGLGLAAALVASLAWAGHGAATPGGPGELHLAADVLHLLAAGLWAGTLVPLALFIAAAQRRGDAALAAAAVRRYSALAAASVVTLFAAGLVNTWFLAGTVPALVGTEYGRLLLAKIALFMAMLVIAAVNLRRFRPRLADPRGDPAATIARLRRNALIEAGLGLAVIAIVGVLGTLPPGAHQEPGWPFPYRIALAKTPGGSQVLLAMVGILALVAGVAAAAAAAAGRYRRAAIAAGGVALCAVLATPRLRPALEPAYPTSFYAPSQPYAAPSVARGAAVYAEYCALCHGAGGRGDGRAAAQQPTRPADLTAAHLFAHSPGDLFWWISNGRGNGAMPGYAAVLPPARRWDVINFIRARAAGGLVRNAAPGLAPQYKLPDFAFEREGVQRTLREALAKGPALLVLYKRPAPLIRLRQLAAAHVQAIAVDLADTAEAPLSGQSPRPPFVVGVSREVRSVLALFRAPDDGGESELLLDGDADVQAYWTTSGHGGLPDAATLAAFAAGAARVARKATSHAGHGR